MEPPSTRFYNALQEQSLRHGALALVLFSCAALLTNIVLPYIIQDDEPGKMRDVTKDENSWCGRINVKQHLTLARAWMMSHILTAASLFALTVGESFLSSVIFVTLLGVSWGLTQWAPFAIIGGEIAAESSPIHSYSDHSMNTSGASSDSESLTASDDLDPEKQQNLSGASSRSVKSMAATTMGVHNIAISMPQMLSAVLSGFIFVVAGPLQLGPTETLAWVLRVGVVAAACAAYLARGI